MDVYSETILEHYRHPQGKGTLPSPTVRHEEVNPSCGDSLTLFIQIDDNVVTNATWEGQGCAISQAGMSLLSEEWIGKTLQELEALSPLHMKELLGVQVGPRRAKCALLSLHAMKNALREATGKHSLSWAETLSAWDEETTDRDLI